MTDTMTPDPAVAEQAPGLPPEQLEPTPSEQPPPPNPGSEQPPPPNPDAASNQPMSEQSASMSDIPVVPNEKHVSLEDEIKSIADDYVIPMSESGIRQWADALKDKDIKKFKVYAEQVAVGLYPTFEVQISAGLPTRVLLDPYVQMASQVLGPMMTEPDWTDPKWAKALQGGLDPKTNRPVPLPLDQWKQSLMTDPGHGWEFSPAAHKRANDFVSHMQKEFSAGPEEE